MPDLYFCCALFHMKPQVIYRYTHTSTKLLSKFSIFASLKMFQKQPLLVSLNNGLLNEIHNYGEIVGHFYIICVTFICFNRSYALDQQLLMGKSTVNTSDVSAL